MINPTASKDLLHYAYAYWYKLKSSQQLRVPLNLTLLRINGSCITKSVTTFEKQISGSGPIISYSATIVRHCHIHNDTCPEGNYRRVQLKRCGELVLESESDDGFGGAVNETNHYV